MDTAQVKQFFKEAEASEALAMYSWITGAMEVRGLIQIAGMEPKRKRRKDAGTRRGTDLVNGQTSLTGLPDEDQR